MAGLGRLGHRHAENIAFHDARSRAGGGVQRDPGGAGMGGSQISSGPAAYTDYGTMLQDKSLDAIFLCTPSGLHCRADRGRRSKPGSTFSARNRSA